MKKIVFVCTGNTCRSPMAELILKDKLKKGGIKGIRVTSAGLSATDGHKMSANSKKALREKGINPYNFRAKRLTKELFFNSDAIICMTEGHKNALPVSPKVKTIEEVSGVREITDPYGQSLEVYKATLKEIEKACEIIYNLIKGEQNEDSDRV